MEPVVSCSHHHPFLMRTTWKQQHCRIKKYHTWVHRLCIISENDISLKAIGYDITNHRIWSAIDSLPVELKIRVNPRFLNVVWMMSRRSSQDLETSRRNDVLPVGWVPSFPRTLTSFIVYSNNIAVPSTHARPPLQSIKQAISSCNCKL